MEFKEKLRTYKQRVESAMSHYLPAEQTRPSRIHEAMRYSMEAGGKRLRPILLHSTAKMLDAKIDAMPAAIAVECVHTYSLIHDDLPSIDNGDLRRGLPTCHKRFGEATAVLAGDALLTYAFQLVSRAYNDHPAICANLVSELSETAGSERLIGGQMEDILGEGAPLSEETLRYIHLNKTSALIESSLVMGGIVAEADQTQTVKLREYGRQIGLAFQIIDDILDETSDAKTIGKSTGSDAQLEKTTYVKIYGLEQSRAFAHQHTQAAIAICRQLPCDASFLEGLARHLENRLN